MEGRLIASRKPITKWSVLALVVVVAGGTLTLILDQIWLNTWFHSGRAYPVNQKLTIELPPGQSLVYYESPVAVPSANAALQLFDSEGDRIRPGTPGHDVSYRLLFSGWSGRALWKLNIPRAGVYGFVCYNYNYSDDREIPAEDRVVFLKRPDSLEDVQFIRAIIEVTGATITITLMMIFYTLHGLALLKRRLADPSQAVSRPATMSAGAA